MDIPPQCVFTGCNKKRIARGLCHGHYKQNQLGKELYPLRKNWGKGAPIRQVVRLGDLCYVPLGPEENNEWAVCDWEQAELVGQFNWCKGSHYAVQRDAVVMHKLIVGVDEGQYDHINRDKYDNRLSNLRPATTGQNSANTVKTSRPTSSRFKGVCFTKKNQLWRARITVNTKEVFLGYFKEEEDAGKAYNDAALKFWGEFAWMNPL